MYHEATSQQTLSYLSDCAGVAEEIRRQHDDLVFVAGCELTFFMKGLVSGETARDRMSTFTKPWRLVLNSIMMGSFNKRLNEFWSEGVPEIRARFKGPITYASGMWEDVDWTPFDYVSVDCYRDSFNKNGFRKNLQKYAAHGKPVVATEFGCCTYKGAAEKGGYGFAIVDWSKDPPKLEGSFVRDEKEQAALMMEMLQMFEEENLHGAFAFTFVMPKYTYNEDPQLDLDIASFALVKSLMDRKGIRYPDMPWEPKLSFDDLGRRYAGDLNLK